MYRRAHTADRYSPARTLAVPARLSRLWFPFPDCRGSGVSPQKAAHCPPADGRNTAGTGQPFPPQRSECLRLSQFRGGPVINRFTGCLSADLYELLSNPNVAGIDLEFMSLEVCTGKDIVLKANGDPLIYRDNVFVLPVGDDLIVDQPLNLAKYVDRFYEHFEDAFDFLVFLPTCIFLNSSESKEPLPTSPWRQMTWRE